MIDALKRLAARVRPAPAPAPVVEVEDDPAVAYTQALAEEIINALVDQLDAKKEQIRSLTSELVKANASITYLRKMPKNRYQGKGR
jgi:hypothetical protein